MHELHSKLIQEETGLKNQGSHSVYYVSHRGNQGTRKKFVKKHDKGRGPLKINDGSMQLQKKTSKSNNCHLCGKSKHFQKDCQKRKSWFEKKCEFNVHVCFESNLTKVLHNTYMVD